MSELTEEDKANKAHNCVYGALADLSMLCHRPDLIKHLDTTDDISLGAVIGLARKIIARRGANGNHLSGRPASPPGLYGPP